MATEIFANTGQKFTIGAAGLYILGDGSGGYVSTMCIQLVNSASLSASIAVVARSRGQQMQLDDPTGANFVGINYLNMYVNGSTGDQTYVHTAITTNTLILVPATGLEIGLNVTYTSGSALVYWGPFEGAAA